MQQYLDDIQFNIAKINIKYIFKIKSQHIKRKKMRVLYTRINLLL